MPIIIDPNQDKSNGVGKVFTRINLILSIGLPLCVLIFTILWGAINGYTKFF